MSPDMPRTCKKASFLAPHQAGEEEMNAHNVDDCPGTSRLTLVVLAQPPLPPQPGKVISTARR